MMEPPKLNINVAEERKKPRLVAITFSEYANQGALGTLNLLGIFDQLFVPKLPNQVVQGQPLILFVRVAEAVENDVQVTIIDPEGKAIAAVIFNAQDQKGHQFEHREFRQVQLIAPVQFPITTHGLYWFDVSYKEVSLGGAGLLITPPVEAAKEAEEAKENDHDERSS